MPEISPVALAAIILISWLAGIGKVAFGIGAGAFLTPLMALVLPPKVAVALMAPIMIVTDMSALHHHWRKWHPGHVLVLLPTYIVGILGGGVFLAWASTDVVRKAIGLIALLFVAIQLSRLGKRASASRVPMPAWGGWIVGLVAGITTTVSHSGGIILSIYLLTAGLAKNAFIASVVALFFFSNLVKIPLYWEIGILTLPILALGLALSPVMIFGGRLGLWVNRRLTVEQFTMIVVVIVGLSGLLLIFTN